MSRVERCGSFHFDNSLNKNVVIRKILVYNFCDKEKAELKSKSQLFKNLREVQTLTLTALRGDPKYKAAECFYLKGAGKFDGKYFIDNVTHSKDGTYTCSITAHLVVTQIG